MYSGRPISEDEKAAAALLAGKSPEDQLLALKQALAVPPQHHQSYPICKSRL
jgi:hypothetical protein